VQSVLLFLDVPAKKEPVSFLLNPGSCGFQGIQGIPAGMHNLVCAAIPIMDLIQEDHHIPVIFSKPFVYCIVFEDNAGALELARFSKLHPSTKHLNVCYHHFCEHV
jgi:hypothetical protein